MFERKVMINHFNNNIFCKINLCSIWFNFSFDPMNRFGITLLKRVIIYTIYVLSNKLISKFPSIVFKWSFLTWTKTAMMSTEINLAKKLNSLIKLILNHINLNKAPNSIEGFWLKILSYFFCNSCIGVCNCF